MLALLCFFVVFTASLHQGQAVETMIPLYVYPSNGAWTPLIDAYNAQTEKIGAWVIVNPRNGPGDTIDSSYTEGIQTLRNAGFKLMGYVHTDYTKVDINTVKAAVYKWTIYYEGITGIFVDEMDNVMSDKAFSYYNELNEYIKSKGFEFAAGNPGTAIDKGLINIFDTTVVYENRGFPSDALLDQITFQGETPAIPADKFTIMAYNVSKLDSSMTYALDKVGYIYMQTLNSDPWNYLPPQSFLEDQFQFYATGEIPDSN